MAKKGELPDLIFVHPIGHGRNKIRHKHVVFVVEEWDEYGRPRKLVLAHDEDVFDMEQIASSGREFMTGYIQGHMTQPCPDRANKKAT